MPPPSLRVDWRDYQSVSSRIQALVPSLRSLPPAHRKLVAEIAMIRLFFIVENTLASAAAKLLCGAPYLDTTRPARLVNATSLAGAFAQMRQHGRAAPKRYLSWTQSKEIRDNLGLTLDVSDPFFATVSRHAALLTEMRYVRNHIVHSNSGTRSNFRKVVTSYYGGLKRGITPGLLLLTDGLGTPCLLERYVVASRVVVREILRA